MKLIHFVFFLLFCLFQQSLWAYGKAYDQASFDDRLASGQAIVVHVHADWCSTCRAQNMILDKLVKEGHYSDIEFLQVNFDDQKDVLNKFDVKYQSTLILFKNGQEVDRLSTQRNISAITKLLDKSKK